MACSNSIRLAAVHAQQLQSAVCGVRCLLACSPACLIASFHPHHTFPQPHPSQSPTHIISLSNTVPPFPTITFPTSSLISSSFRRHQSIYRLRLFASNSESFDCRRSRATLDVRNIHSSFFDIALHGTRNLQSYTRQP